MVFLESDLLAASKNISHYWASGRIWRWSTNNGWRIWNKSDQIDNLDKFSLFLLLLRWGLWRRSHPREISFWGRKTSLSFISGTNFRISDWKGFLRNHSKINQQQNPIIQRPHNYRPDPRVYSDPLKLRSKKRVLLNIELISARFSSISFFYCLWKPFKSVADGNGKKHRSEPQKSAPFETKSVWNWSKVLPLHRIGIETART
jgi:hypothetical protein